MLLYDEVYLSWPYWLDESFHDLLEESELWPHLRLIPDGFYKDAKRRSYQFLESARDLSGYRWKLSDENQKTQQFALWDSMPDLLYGLAEPELTWEYPGRELDNYKYHVFLNAILYRKPLIEASLCHLGRTIRIERSSIACFHHLVYRELLEQFEVDGESLGWISPALDRELGSRVDLASKHPTYIFSPGELSLDTEQYARQLCELGSLLDTSAATLAITSFSSQERVPIKSSAFPAGSVAKLAAASTTPRSTKDAYGLYQLQFGKMRFPVLDEISDVIRLRDDPRLNSYREVMHYYSNALTSREKDWPTVVREFSRDLDLAARRLYSLTRTCRVLDYTVYASIPLSLASVLAGFPLGDVIILPVSAAAMIYRRRLQRKVEWLLFGSGVS